MIDIYSNRDFVKWFKMSPSQAIHWTERGLISFVVDSRGRGSQRGYDIQGVFQAGIVKSLFDMGLSLHMVKSIMAQLVRHEKLENIMDQLDKPRHDLVEIIEKGPIGVLLYYLMKDGPGRLFISLRPVRDVLSGFTEDSLPNEGISNISGFIFLDLGSIWWRVHREALKVPRKETLTDLAGEWEHSTENIPTIKKK